MKGQKKQLIIMSILLVAIVAAFIITKYVIVDSDLVQVDEVVSAVYHVDKESVIELKYTALGETVELIKENGIWVLADNKSVALDQDKIEEILGFAAYLNSKSVIEEPSELSEYGLDNPDYIIYIKTTEGNEHRFYIGDEFAINHTYFAMVECDDTIYTIESTYPKAFVTDIESLQCE